MPGTKTSSCALRRHWLPLPLAVFDSGGAWRYLPLHGVCLPGAPSMVAVSPSIASVYLASCLSLSYTHTLTHILSHTYSHTHTLTRILSHTYSVSLLLTLFGTCCTVSHVPLCCKTLFFCFSFHCSFLALTRTHLLFSTCSCIALVCV